MSLLTNALSFGKAGSSKDFWALRDINLDIEPGCTLGILGHNGAGKSTLLSILAGVSQPSTGTVEVNGRLAAIFGMGAGFNPEFTGRENVMLNGLILGIDRREMLERFPEIEDFANLGDFMELPVSTYSSGMRARLGFAVAIMVDPEILIIDEALSAGDATFKKKALQRMYDLRDSGSTVLFVSHSLGIVTKFCTDAVLLHKGQLVTTGDPKDVAERYEEIVSLDQGQGEGQVTKEDLKLSDELDDMLEHEGEENFEPGAGSEKVPAFESRPPGSRVREAEVREVELLNEEGELVDKAPSGSTLTARIHLQYTRAVENGALGIVLHNRKAGLDVFSTDTIREDVPLGQREKGERATVDFTFEVPLQAGRYRLGVFFPNLEDEDSQGRVEAADFKIKRPDSEQPVQCLVHLPTTIAVHNPDKAREKPGRPT